MVRQGKKVQGEGPVAAESYRYFLRAAVLIGALAGAALGAINLTWIATWGYTGMMPNWPWWSGLVQAHGDAQLYGWCGLFIIGIASHSLPHMLRKPGPSARLARCIFCLILGGILLGLVAQPLAAEPAPAALFVLSTGLQWTGVLLFAAWLVLTVRRPPAPFAGFVLAGTLWLCFGASLRLIAVALAVRNGVLTPPAALNAAYLHAMSWGFLLSYVAGYSLRLLPAFVGLTPAPARVSWAALGVLSAGVAGEIAARLLEHRVLSLAAVALSTAGVLLLVCALRPWSRLLTAEDADARLLAWFVRAAYAWLAVAALLLLGLRTAEALMPVTTLHQHAFGGASRHALTVGFVSLMIVGVAGRILPVFSGAARPHPTLMPALAGSPLYGRPPARRWADRLRAVGRRVVWRDGDLRVAGDLRGQPVCPGGAPAAGRDAGGRGAACGGAGRGAEHRRAGRAAGRPPPMARPGLRPARNGTGLQPRLPADGGAAGDAPAGMPPVPRGSRRFPGRAGRGRWVPRGCSLISHTQAVLRPRDVDSRKIQRHLAPDGGSHSMCAFLGDYP
jgi:hypothetical protein